MQDRDANEHSASAKARARADGQAAYMRHAGAGLQFALTFLGLGLVGWWLDGRLGSAPWLLICGIVVGAAGGMYSLAARLGALPGSKRRDPPDPPR